VLRNSSGGVVSRHDYLPFGEEIGAGIGNRTSGMGFGLADGNRQKFTSKQRDNETGLDFFEARFFSSTQGRFLSVDIESASLSTPQSFNKYQYCLNNPLRYVDPDGRYNRDVHYELTLVLALAVGFPEKVAQQIAFATQDVDDNPAKQPMPSRHGFGTDRRRKYHFTTEQQRQELWNIFAGSGSADDLGDYLHAMQDSYSHAGFEPFIGHAPRRDVDNTREDVSKADMMAENTYNRLDWAADIMKAKGTISNRIDPMPWGMISGLVHDFNTASSQEEKRYILMVLRARINNWREAQLRKRKAEQSGGSTNGAAAKPKKKPKQR